MQFTNPEALYIYLNQQSNFLFVAILCMNYFSHLQFKFPVLRWVKHTSQIGDAQVSSTFYRDRGPICGAVTSIDAQSSGWSQGESKRGVKPANVKMNTWLCPYINYVFFFLWSAYVHNNNWISTIFIQGACEKTISTMQCVLRRTLQKAKGTLSVMCFCAEK